MYKFPSATSMVFIQWWCERGDKSHVSKEISGRGRRSRGEKGNQCKELEIFVSETFYNFFYLFYYYYYYYYYYFIIFFHTFFYPLHLPTPTPTPTTHTRDPRPLPTTHDPRHLATLVETTQKERAGEVCEADSKNSSPRFYSSFTDTVYSRLAHTSLLRTPR